MSSNGDFISFLGKGRLGRRWGEEPPGREGGPGVQEVAQWCGEVARSRTGPT